MAHAHYMLNKACYKHTLRMCYTYRISITTIVAQTRTNVTLQHVACLVKYNSGHTYPI